MGDELLVRDVVLDHMIYTTMLGIIVWCVVRRPLRNVPVSNKISCVVTVNRRARCNWWWGCWNSTERNIQGMDWDVAAHLILVL